MTILPADRKLLDEKQGCGRGVGRGPARGVALEQHCLDTKLHHRNHLKNYQEEDIQEGATPMQTGWDMIVVALSRAVYGRFDTFGMFRMDC